MLIFPAKYSNIEFNLLCITATISNYRPALMSLVVKSGVFNLACYYNRSSFNDCIWLHSGTKLNFKFYMYFRKENVDTLSLLKFRSLKIRNYSKFGLFLTVQIYKIFLKYCSNSNRNSNSSGSDSSCGSSSNRLQY